MPYQIIEYRNHTINIDPDTDPFDPRTEHDNSTVMVCNHGKYKLGDEHNWTTPHAAVDGTCSKLISNYEGSYDLESAFEALSKAPCVMCPLYLYDHSGITISTSPFSCPWDSGQVGFVYISYEILAKECGIKDAGPGWEPNNEHLQIASAIIKGEVSAYDDYLTGNVWQYRITKGVGEDENTECASYCGGFVGNREYCIEAAKEEIDGEFE